MPTVPAATVLACAMREILKPVFRRKQDMDLKTALRNGMRVVGPDNREYGTIERFDDTAAYVQGRRVPFAAIGHVERDRLYVDTPELWGLSGSAGPDAAPERERAGAMPAREGTGATMNPGTTTNRQDTDATLGGEARVPLLEEQVEFGTRVVDLGEIRVHKTVEAREEVRRGPLAREDVQIERVRVNRPVDAPEQRREEGDWLVIPIMEEVFVVQKQLMVIEEIRIRKHLVTEEREVRETIRRERASIEDTRPAEAIPSSRRTEPARADNDDGWDELHREVRDVGR
jgi:uncharacterized protein (TIGR02271 family)